MVVSKGVEKEWKRQSLTSRTNSKVTWDRHNRARLALGWLEMIKLFWLSSGWMRLSRAGSQLARDDRAGLAFGWLDTIELVWLSAG
jgi:hypothetical protein